MATKQTKREKLYEEIVTLRCLLATSNNDDIFQGLLQLVRELMTTGPVSLTQLTDAELVKERERLVKKAKADVDEETLAEFKN